ncbi:MAG: ABC transporter ATP-binding protein [Clostridia bacterium]|nr:ABC transporter ATP-binding protein [Clostridia bacterium]
MKNRSTLREIFIYLKPYTVLIILSVLFSAASVVSTLYIPILIGRGIDCIVGAGRVDFVHLKPILIEVIIVACTTAVLQWLINTINNRITFKTVRDIRNAAFEKIQELPFAYLDSHPSGEIVSRVIADADQFADGLLLGFTQLFTGIVTIIGTLIFMLTIHVGITFIVVVLTPLSFFMAKFIAKRTYSMFREQSQTRGEQTAFIDEIIGNQKTVKAFSREKPSIEKFDEINDRLEKCSLRATFYSSLTNPCTRFINSLVYTGVGLGGALIAVGGGISIGSLTCFLSYANQYTKPFNEISGVITEFQNALACAARLFELIHEQPQSADGSLVLKDTQGNVELENVSFSYSPERELIKDLNLNVKSDQRIAIVGPTGCGKTTVINLLMRFYDVDRGNITVDGENIQKLTRRSLRRSYGMVLQDTWLKTGTIRENIVMGKPDASDEEVVAAAKAAHSHSFIKRLPKGYDTVISEGGEGLSQGQRQLLCITRIMLCLPPMLILDEATSSIDTRTEVRIQKAFARMMEGRTTFIVAHRLSTIREADVILVMRDGNIIEQGNHTDLLQKNGFYAKLYNSQFEET